MVETMTVDGSAANSSACTAGGGKGAGVRDAGVRDAGVQDAGCLCGGLSVDSVVAGLDVAALKAEIAALSRVDALVVARRSAVVAELARRDGDVAEQLRKSGNMSGRQARITEFQRYSYRTPASHRNALFVFPARVWLGDPVEMSVVASARVV